MKITDDCLNITFSASGCDGKSWKYKLIASDNIDFLVTTDEPSTGQLAQRNLRLSLENNEICLAVIPRETSFDITTLKVDGERSVELKIVNGNSSIIYDY